MIRSLMTWLFPPQRISHEVVEQWPQPTKEEFERQFEEQFRQWQAKERQKAADNRQKREDEKR